MDDELYTSINFFKRINPLLPEVAVNLQHPVWPEIDQFVQSQNISSWPQFYNITPYWPQQSFDCLRTERL
jgi:hypothetical protein